VEEAFGNRTLTAAIFIKGSNYRRKETITALPSEDGSIFIELLEGYTSGYQIAQVSTAYGRSCL